MDWTECKNNKFAKESKTDKNLIQSLIKASQKRQQTEKLIQLNETTASSKLSLAYDALRELLEALAISKGYKIYNHECFCAFLKEIIKESQLGDQFNKIRKIRNAINYYGKDITTEEAEKIIKDINTITEKIRKKVK